MTAIGFPDFRRQVDYDTNPNLSDLPFAATGSPVTYGAFNCANFSHVAGVLSADTAMTLWRFRFYSDFAITTQVGERQILMDPTVGLDTYFRIPAQGRYFTVTITSAGAVVFGHGHHIVGSSRGGPVEIMPTNAILVQTGLVTVNAGVSTTWNLNGGSGHCSWMIFANTTPGQFTLSSPDSLAGGYDTIAGRLLPIGTFETLPVVLPLAPAKLTISNTGGANGLYRGVVVCNTSRN